MKRQTGIISLILACSCLFWGCTPEDPEGDAGQGGDASGAPEITLDANTPRSIMGVTLKDLAGCSVKMGTKKIQPVVGEDGRWTLDPKDDNSSEMTVYSDGVRLPFGGRADDKNAKIPYSQFYGSTLNTMKSYPLFARKNKNGNYVLKDAFAMIDLEITGSANINSIKLRSKNGKAISVDGQDFVVLNCVQEDGSPVSLPARFQIPIQAGNYKDLEVTICDDRFQMRRLSAGVIALSAGETKSIKAAYAPLSTLYFYEGFDNCVWGADPIGDKNGYAPDSDESDRYQATGYENAYSLTRFAGTGLIQTDDVESVFAMTPSYLKSRGFDRWKYLLRAKEFQGCVGVGVGYKSRGWIQTPALTNVVGPADVTFSFNYKVADLADEGMEVQCLGAGAFKGVILDDGVQQTISGASYVLDSLALEPGWHKLEFLLSNVTNATSLRVGGYQKKDVTHGFYIDDLTVSKSLKPVEADKNSIEGLSALTTLSTVELNMKIDVEGFVSEPLEISLPSGGFFTGMKVDGIDVEDERTQSEAWVPKASYVFDPQEYETGTHDVVFTVESADKDMTVRFEGDASMCRDMSVTKLSSIEKKDFRILLWNIQFGMWADQGNNYDNFVAWLKKYDADCCVFIEAETVRKSGSSTPESASLKKLNGSSGGTYGWSKLAARYSHNYVATSADKDNYSQEITSKTSVSRVLALYETSNSKKPIQHGAGYFTLTAAGRKINVVTYHAMPYNYDPTASDKAASETLREGDAYRQHEVEYILSQTVNNSRYSSEKNWLFLGDMNSHSPADNWYYGYSSSSILSVQTYIRSYSGLKDIIAEKYPGRFLPTTMNGKFRIDYIYASDAMMNAVTNAVVIRDKWTSEKATAVADCTHPSDHRPILVDFDF